MTRKRNHRMRAHRINIAAGANAIANSQPTQAADVCRIMVLVRTAYERLKSGTTDEADFTTVAAAINVGMIRSEAIAPELEGMFKAGGEAMLEAARIFRRHGKFGFRGPHIIDMNAALELYEQMLSLSSPLQMDAAARQAAERYRRGEVQEA